MDRNNVDQKIVVDLVKKGKLIVDFSTGEIYSTRIRGFEGKKKLLSGCVMESGYRYYRLVYKAKKYFLRGHRIVVWAAGNDIPEGKQIDHIDRNKLNNSLKNLRIVTPKENIANSESRIGEKNPSSKLTEKQVVEIITYYCTGDYTQRDLAEMYGVGKSQIGNIVTGKSWNIGGKELSPSKHRADRIKGLGNAWVPQVAIEIMKGIKQIDIGRPQKREKE